MINPGDFDLVWLDVLSMVLLRCRHLGWFSKGLVWVKAVCTKLGDIRVEIGVDIFGRGWCRGR